MENVEWDIDSGIKNSGIIWANPLVMNRWLMVDQWVICGFYWLIHGWLMVINGDLPSGKKKWVEVPKIDGSSGKSPSKWMMK